MGRKINYVEYQRGRRSILQTHVEPLLFQAPANTQRRHANQSTSYHTRKKLTSSATLRTNVGVWMGTRCVQSTLAHRTQDPEEPSQAAPLHATPHTAFLQLHHSSAHLSLLSSFLSTTITTHPPRISSHPSNQISPPFISFPNFPPTL